MFTRLFDDTDVTSLTRALIPWTATVIVPQERAERAFLVRRTTAGYALPEWRLQESIADVQVARAARSIYVSHALSRAAAAVAHVAKEAFSELRSRVRLAPARV